MSLNIKYENMLDDFEPNDGYARIDYYDEETINKLAEHYYEILKLIGDNPDREGLEKTPIRVAKSMQFLMHGYYADPEQILRSAMFKEDYREMVIVKDIEIYSMCEHHMLPFFGKAHVAYIPNGNIVGLSKIARVVDVYAQIASARATNYANQRLYTKCFTSSWSSCSNRSTSFMYDDERCAKTKLRNGNIRFHWCI